MRSKPFASQGRRPGRRAAIEAPARRAIEPLEDRMLLAVFAHVNFQPAAAPVPTGYFVDSGLAYANRGNGFTYGWWYQPATPANSPPVAVNNPAVRDRNAAISPDQAFDTLNHVHNPQSPGGNNESIPVWWEIAVPNGTYQVRLVAGDPSNVDSHHHFVAEAPRDVNGVPDQTTGGVELVNLATDGAPEGPGRWVDSGFITVTVTDGTLTISESANARNGKVNFIQIDSEQAVNTPANPTSLQVTSTAASKVGLQWVDASSNENGFRVERSLDGTTWSPFATVAPNTQTFTALGLNPQTTYHFRVFAFNTAGDSAQPTNAVNTTTLAATGNILPEFANTTGDVNLTAEGALDWAHWGHPNQNSFVHKTGVTSLISDVTPLPGTPRELITTSPTTFSWTDGTPEAAVTATPNVLQTLTHGHGFTFTVPADTTPRVLRVYVGVNNLRGELTARLSDGSAPDYVNTFFNGGVQDGVYTLVYRAGSNGQTMDVTWRAVPPDGDQIAGRINLKAATIQPVPPPPTGVTNALAATPLNSGRIGLTWTDQSTGETWYNVERAPDNGGTPGAFTFLAQANGLSFVDGTAAQGTRYHYRVVPSNVGGSGSPSSAAAATAITGTFGTGARATYYDEPTLTDDLGAVTKNPRLGPIWPTTSTDPTIDFAWGNNAPTGAGAGFGADVFVVRWTARIKPEFTGLYTFATDTDDGARVTVNGQKVIDLLDQRHGQLGRPRDFGTPVELQAGQEYDVMFDVSENTGGAGARLYWAHANLPVEIVPQAVMTPAAPDLTGPTVLRIEVDPRLPAGVPYTSAAHVGVVFSEDIANSLEVADMFFYDGANFITGNDLTVHAYDPATATTYITFNNRPVLPDGNWQLVIYENTVSDTSGNALDADGNPQTPAGQFEGRFYVLQGDTQRNVAGNSNPDRVVDFIDFQILEKNFGRTNASASDGDFDHDGDVDNADFQILMSRFGTRLDAPQPAAAVASNAAPAPAPVTAAPVPVKKPAPAKKAAPAPKAKPVVVGPVKATPAKFATKKIAGVKELLK